MPLYNRPGHRHFCERTLLSGAVGFLIAAVLTASAAADLSADQKKLLEEAQKHAQQAEENLKLAQQSAGPGEGKPTGSKAKLAQVRLNSAKQLLAQVKGRLSKLPGDDAGVQ